MPYSAAMNAASAIVSARAAQPDSSRAWARASAILNAFAALVALVFNLIEHGRHLALTVRRHIREAGYGLAGRCFGTNGIRVIYTNIRRGVALHKALWQRANRRLGLRLPALQCDHTPSGRNGVNAPVGAAAKDNSPAVAAHTHWWQPGDLSHLSAVKAVADEARRRASRAILPGTSPAFGAATKNASAFWDQLFVPIDRFGCSLTQFIAEVDRRKAPASRIETPRFGVPPEHHCLDCLLAEEQLCDRAPPQQSPAECLSPEAGPCPESSETFARTETAPALRWPASPAPAWEVATSVVN